MKYYCKKEVMSKWSNWPTIGQLIEAYENFCGCSNSRVLYKGNGEFVYEGLVYYGYPTCDVDVEVYVIEYIEMYKTYLAYKEWLATGKCSMLTPHSNEEETYDLPF